MAPEKLQFRKPVVLDGPAVTALIARCPPLDRNSAYCNLLQCTHFSEHCIIAEMGGKVIGWVSGYRPPSEPSALFIWQVAVGQEGRNRKLASGMINALLRRSSQQGVNHLITTITDDNHASWALFQGLARDWNTALERQAMFDSEAHFAGTSATEYMARIGPIKQRNIKD